MVCAERHARLEPLLQAIYDFLDKQPALVERVRRDLVRGLKQPWPTHSRAPRRNPTGAGPPLVGPFLGATDIALVTIGRIANNRILEYQADGKKVREWGNNVTAAGEFDLPHASRRIRIHPAWRKLGEQVIRFNQGRLCTSHPYASPANCFDPTVK